MPKTKRLVIEIRGGCVDAVFASDPYFQVEIFDHDVHTVGDGPEDEDGKPLPPPDTTGLTQLL